MVRRERGPVVELGDAKGRVEVGPVGARARTTEVRRLVNAAIIAGVEGVQAGECDSVEIRMQGATAVHAADIREARSSVARGEHGDSAENRMCRIGGIDTDNSVVIAL